MLAESHADRSIDDPFNFLKKILILHSHFIHRY